MKVWAVVLAAGRGSRLSELPCSKQFLPLAGRPLYWHSVSSLAKVARLGGLVLVFPPDQMTKCEQTLAELAPEISGLPILQVSGGPRRQDSVYNGLKALPPACTHVLIHDGARPFVTPFLANRICDELEKGLTAVIPAVEVTDTVKEVEAGRVLATPERNRLKAVQTPQGFALPQLLSAYAEVGPRGLEVTDDARLMELCGHTVHVVPGEVENIKITTRADLRGLEQKFNLPNSCLQADVSGAEISGSGLFAGACQQIGSNAPSSIQKRALPCTGYGYDVHKYGEGRPMKLGGVPISGAPEVIAHSDGDVLLHALTDALLGCLAEGDIGQLFPDSDARFDNIDSGILLSEVLDLALKAGLEITHVDLTVIAQIPRLSPWRDNIRKNVASLMRLPKEWVNVKATTEEGLGFTGEKKGIKAVAVVSAIKFCEI